MTFRLVTANQCRSTPNLPPPPPPRLGTSLLPRSRTSSVGKVDDSKSGGPRFESRHGHMRKICLCCWTRTLPKVVLDNDHLLSLDYEYGNGALEYVKHSYGALQIL